MIDSLDVRNFRGYDTLSLSKLRQFNFIIGESGSGKTALLEALWIVGGISPEIYFRMRAMRGLGTAAQLNADGPGYALFFKDIFRDPTESEGAQIQIIDSMGRARSLGIHYDTQLTLLEASKSSTSTTTAPFRPIVFVWRLGEKEYRLPLTIVNNQIVLPSSPPEPFPAILLSSSHTLGAAEAAGWLSSFSIQKRKDVIVTAVRKIYPQLEDLSSELVGGQQMIWVSLQNVPERLPLPVISSGINKYVNLLLASYQNLGGVLLVDEFENGFYYDDYKEIVRGIVEFCISNSVQLFASTHSYELLEAVADVMTGQEEKFSLLRTKYLEGLCSVTTIEGKPSKAAIDQNMEVR